MNRVSWIHMKKTIACTLGAVGLWTGVAWADPSGTANVRQIMSVGSFVGPTIPPTAEQQQRTFLTNDPILVLATYYDPADACNGVDPLTVKFFIFNLEGQLVLGKNRDAASAPTNTVYNSRIGTSKYQALLASLAPGELPVGSYNVVFRVEACPAGDPAILVSGFYSIRVLAP
jgi:hypothetical protein